jgi:hypothetical protein
VKHSEALRAAIEAGYTHGTSYYSYYSRKLTNILREALREEAESYDAKDDWYFDPNKGVVSNKADSECHYLWVKARKKGAGAA